MYQADPKLLRHIWAVKKWNGQEFVGTTDDIEGLRVSHGG